MNNSFQRNTDWYLARKGMLTASEIVNILTKGRGKDEVFGKTALTYLNDKVAERLMSDEMFIYYMEDIKKSTPAMRWGTEYEEEAIKHYEEITGVTIMDCPFTPLKGYEDFVGGSPDGRRSTLDRIIEVKCPYNPSVHIEHCSWTKPEDLKAGNPQYYCQVQTNMLDTSTEMCDFISYSPLFSDGIEMHILEVPIDEPYVKNLVERIDLAVEYIKMKLEAIRKMA